MSDLLILRPSPLKCFLITFFLLAVGVGCSGQWSNSKVEETYRRAGLVIDAIEAFREKHGNLPAQLSDLVPEFLAYVPLPQAGERLWRFELESDGAQFSLGFGGPSPEDSEHYYVSSLDDWVVDTK